MWFLRDLYVFFLISVICVDFSVFHAAYTIMRLSWSPQLPHY